MAEALNIHRFINLYTLGALGIPTSFQNKHNTEPLNGLNKKKVQLFFLVNNLIEIYYHYFLVNPFPI